MKKEILFNADHFSFNLLYEIGREFKVDCKGVIHRYLRTFPTVYNTKRLIELYGIDTIYDVLENRMNAKIRFPDLEHKYIQPALEYIANNEIVEEQVHIEQLQKLNNISNKCFEVTNEVKFNNTVTHFAAQLGYTKALESFVIPSLDDLSPNVFGYTPLHCALRYHNIKSFVAYYKLKESFFKKNLDIKKFLIDIKSFNLDESDMLMIHNLMLGDNNEIF